MQLIRADFRRPELIGRTAEVPRELRDSSLATNALGNSNPDLREIAPTPVLADGSTCHAWVDNPV